MSPFTQSQIQILVSHEEQISVLELGWCPVQLVLSVTHHSCFKLLLGHSSSAFCLGVFKWPFRF